ncbi:hypothetical protein AUJ10_03840 [Candidatus Pacearchaeota archaeon CG1_02_31_27]|nr:MAG: hypothetical protein AUJ10_03840 [Candidatus Pacearchaeota archaeon CG1_02_31_27]
MLKDLLKIIVIAILVAGISIFGTYFYLTRIKTPQEKFLSPQEAAQNAINYINENLLQKGVTASLVDVVEENGLYKIRLKVGEKEFISYVTKDGKILFPEEGIDLEKKIAKEETPTSTQEIQKTDKPDVKLFVMAYCPYGLQMEKAYLPVYNLLKEKADMGIYFVNYIMHEKKEIDENLRQYCIQKEEKEKYYDYLSCFVKAGEFEKCLNEAKIDKEKMNSCISETDKEYKITQLYNDKSTWLSGRYPRFDVHTDLNEKYGVQGSPTVVINDKVVEVSSRSPEKFKEVICQAFNSPPEECSQTLSNTTFSPGFGLETGTSSGGGCGQ